MEFYVSQQLPATEKEKRVHENALGTLAPAVGVTIFTALTTATAR